MHDKELTQYLTKPTPEAAYELAAELVRARREVEEAKRTARYLLSCATATLEGLNRKKTAPASELRRYRVIVATGLESIKQGTLTARWTPASMAEDFVTKRAEEALARSNLK